MRLFLALPVLDLDLLEERKKLKNSLEKEGHEYELVSPRDYLIPLVELGDMGRESFLSLYENLKTIKESAPPFQVRLSGLWAYPQQHEANLLWIDVQNSRELRSLQTEISKRLNIPETAFFRPHLPLVHFKRKKDASDLISPFKRTDFGRVLIYELRIMETLPRGYRLIARYELTEKYDVEHGFNQSV